MFVPTFMAIHPQFPRLFTKNRNVNLILVLWENLGVFKASWQSIQQLSRCFTLEQFVGPTFQRTSLSHHPFFPGVSTNSLPSVLPAPYHSTPQNNRMDILKFIAHIGMKNSKCTIKVIRSQQLQFTSQKGKEWHQLEVHLEAQIFFSGLVQKRVMHVSQDGFCHVPPKKKM